LWVKAQISGANPPNNKMQPNAYRPVIEVHLASQVGVKWVTLGWPGIG
jgi:hypothetical protein